MPGAGNTHEQSNWMSEFNVCGVVVHARPEQLDEVQATLAGMPGVEVHGRSDDGRLVVTVEDSPEHACADTLGAVHRVAGVVSASLVYQHGESN